LRNRWIWSTAGALGLLGLLVLGTWTWRLTQENQGLALTIEAERQRNFAEMIGHVDKLHSLLGKGLVTASTRQNMRFMGDVHYHSQAAVTNVTALPLPANLRASTGKFLQQTGDFALSLMRHEATGGEMEVRQRTELERLRLQAQDLNGQLLTISDQYRHGQFRWNPPIQFGWAALTGRGATAWNRPLHDQQQTISSAFTEGWTQIGDAMDALPVFLYNGPFSDHVQDRKPTASGPPVTVERASELLRTYMPGADRFRVAGVAEVHGTMPAFSFHLVPVEGALGTETYTTTVEIMKNGGQLIQIVSGRATGETTLDLDQAQTIGVQYLNSIGLTDMAPTYGQIDGGTATVAFAYQSNGVMIYPDQAKIKIALDTGEVVAADLRQYMMFHHQRTLPDPTLTVDQAEGFVNPRLEVERRQLALIPDPAGTGEILTYEFLTRLDESTYLVYINAGTGVEEQILQKVQTNDGTFTF